MPVTTGVGGCAGADLSAQRDLHNLPGDLFVVLPWATDLISWRRNDLAKMTTARLVLPVSRDGVPWSAATPPCVRNRFARFTAGKRLRRAASCASRSVHSCAHRRI
jgi:hypothetical protein